MESLVLTMRKSWVKMLSFAALLWAIYRYGAIPLLNTKEKTMKLFIAAAVLLILASPAYAHRASGRVQPKPLTVEAAQKGSWMIRVDKNDGRGYRDYQSYTGDIEGLNLMMNTIARQHPGWSVASR
jgi:hypothetical protein